MSCCGRKQGVSTGMAEARFTSAPRSTTYFRFVGAGSLTVIGRVTGRRYHFPVTGASINADPRDAPAIAAVPHVVAINSP